MASNNQSQERQRGRQESRQMAALMQPDLQPQQQAQQQQQASNAQARPSSQLRSSLHAAVNIYGAAVGPGGSAYPPSSLHNRPHASQMGIRRGSGSSQSHRRPSASPSPTYGASPSPSNVLSNLLPPAMRVDNGGVTSARGVPSSQHQRRPTAPHPSSTALQQQQQQQQERVTPRSAHPAYASGSTSTGAAAMHAQPATKRRGSQDRHRGGNGSSLYDSSMLPANAASAHDPSDHYGRHTPDPPRVSQRMQSAQQRMQPHPPSAPPVARSQARPASQTRPMQAQPTMSAAAQTPYANGLHPHPPPLQPAFTPRMMFDNHHHSHHHGRDSTPSSTHAGTLSLQRHHSEHSTAATPAQSLGMGMGRASSLQQTIQSARSSAYAQLTLQQTNSYGRQNNSSSSQQPSSTHHFPTSPSPNSTPIKSHSYASRFDSLHRFDTSPSTPKELRELREGFAAAIESAANHQGVNGISSFNRKRAGFMQGPTALSWPSEEGKGRGQGGTAGVRSSHPSSPSTHAHQRPSLLAGKRGGGSQAPPATLTPLLSSPSASPSSPSLLDSFHSAAHSHPSHEDDSEDQLDWGMDEWELEQGDYFQPSPVQASTSSSSSSHAHHLNRISKNQRIPSAARHAAAAVAAGIKKLDLSNAQNMRSPYTRKSFSKMGGGGGGADRRGTSASNRPDGFVPAEEWVVSSEEETDEQAIQRAQAYLASQEEKRDGGDGEDGGWILDIGLAADPNPRYRASMEDAHAVKLNFGPRFPVPSSSASSLHSVSEGGGSHSHDPFSSGPYATQAPPHTQGAFFAIYDGHGGRATVDFIEKHFHRELARQLKAASSSSSSSSTPSPPSSSTLSRLIDTACQRVDSSMALYTGPGGRVYGEPFQECGSTACFAYMRPCPAPGGGSKYGGRELFLANIGDAQAVLAVDKKALRGASRQGDSTDGEGGRKLESKRCKRPSSDLRSPSLKKSSSSKTRDRDRATSASSTHSSSPLDATMEVLAKTLTRPLPGSAGVAPPPAPTKQRPLSAMPLSYAHVAKDPKEQARVKAAGGCIFANRVSGCLAVSRAFGDMAMKSVGLSCLPHQQHVTLTPHHKFLIIGCDGIWDVMDGATAVSHVSGMSDAQRMAESLVALALKRGTTDNVSCLVVRFRR